MSALNVSLNHFKADNACITNSHDTNRVLQFRNSGTFPDLLVVCL